jgi:NitT/TauT family transport system ATP-binding protein
VVDVRSVFARPRRVESVKSSPLYGELFGRVWGQLREEVLAATDRTEVTL